MRTVDLQALGGRVVWMMWGCVALMAALAGCSSRPITQAPVEDRSPQRTSARGSAALPPATAVPPSVGVTTGAPSASSPPATASVASRPAADSTTPAGFYTVKPGDTLIRIGLDQGQSWRDIARWNGIENPNLIEVGQVLRVVPPVASTSGAAQSSPVVSSASVESRPLSSTSSPIAASSAAAAAPAASPVSASPAGAGAISAPAVKDAESDLLWSWPAQGSVVTGFDDARNIKGLAIAGKAGEPVVAAADGRVVYAGSGLRGYGNLVIVKHNALYLSAYAHNQTLLVKEDQQVKRGQKIAEMGSTDADRVQLHFEIRRQGKPIDPARMLPPR